jgi:hypothetical protein
MFREVGDEESHERALDRTLKIVEARLDYRPDDYIARSIAAMVLLFVLRAVGVLYQEPAIYPGTALFGAFCLWMMLRRMDAP